MCVYLHRSALTCVPSAQLLKGLVVFLGLIVLSISLFNSSKVQKNDFHRNLTVSIRKDIRKNLNYTERGVFYSAGSWAPVRTSCPEGWYLTTDDAVSSAWLWCQSWASDCVQPPGRMIAGKTEDMLLACRFLHTYFSSAWAGCLASIFSAGSALLSSAGASVLCHPLANLELFSFN